MSIPVGRSSAALPTTHAYGAHPDQVADLCLPVGPEPSEGWPVVMLLHGGFWREPYRRDLMVPLADSVAGQGWAAWNVEYRRVGGAGGWPTTLLDVSAALDHLAVLDAPVDRRRVAVVGHSAGGHLALWAAARHRLPGGAPGSSPDVVPCAVVGLAPVADIRAADDLALSDLAVRAFLGGGPEDVPDRWAVADLLNGVGHGVPALLVHAVDDEDIPPTFSETYAAAAGAAGDPVELRPQTDGGHMGMIDARSLAWGEVLGWLAERWGGTGRPGMPA